MRERVDDKNYDVKNAVKTNLSLWPRLEPAFHFAIRSMRLAFDVKHATEADHIGGFSCHG